MAQETFSMRHDRYVNNNVSEFEQANRHPIEGYQQLPIMTLEKAVETIIPFVDDIQSFVFQAKQKCKRDSNMLTLDESAAIYLYTMPTIFFSRFNDVLRAENRDAIKPWFGFLRLFMSALEKLPSITGTLWRGVAGDIGNFSMKNESQIWWSVNSCSTATNVVEIYLGTTGILFAINVVRGKCISEYSAFPEEEEVILMPGTCLRPKAKPFTDKNLAIVHLQEETIADTEQSSQRSNPTKVPLITFQTVLALAAIASIIMLSLIVIVVLENKQGPTWSIGNATSTTTTSTSTISTTVSYMSISSISNANVTNAGRWTTTGTLAIGRTGHTSTVLLDGRVITVGGNEGRNTIELYDPITQIWSLGTPMVDYRLGHAATLLPDGRLFVTGGYYFNKNIETVEIYNPLTNNWTSVSSMNLARSIHQAVYLPSPMNKILVMGGYIDNPIGSNSCELYDFVTNQWTLASSMTEKRIYFTATYSPMVNKVIVIGGRTAETYDILTDQWTPSANSMANDRYAHTATPIQATGELLIAGSSGYLETTYLFNPITNTFTSAASMIDGRADASATLLPSGLVLVSGGYGKDFVQYWSAEIYDSRFNIWSSVASMNNSRFRHTSVLVNTSSQSPVVLVIGGLKKNFHSTTACELFYFNG